MRIVDLFSGAGGLTFGFYYKLLEGAFIKNNDNFQILVCLINNTFNTNSNIPVNHVNRNYYTY